MSMTLRARTSDRAARTASARNPLNGLFAASSGRRRSAHERPVVQQLASRDEVALGVIRKPPLARAFELATSSSPTQLVLRVVEHREQHESCRSPRPAARGP